MKLLIEKSNYSGIMIALFIPDAIAKSLAIPDGEEPDSLHITLAYVPKVGGDKEVFDKICDAVKDVATEFMPVQGIIGGVGKFSGSETSDFKDVAYASFDSPGLTLLREELMAALDFYGVQPSLIHGFTPHVTLKYLNEGDELPVVKPTSKFTIPKLTIASSTQFQDVPLIGHRITKSSVGTVHVNVPLGEDKVKKNSLGDNDYDLMDMQREVSGTDFELINGAEDAEVAKCIAKANLAGDPYHYKKLMSDGEEDEGPDGYYLDLGSGEKRAPGYLGLDLYPHDHGTIVHDLSLGIPFPDGVAKSIRTSQLDEKLLPEIERVLMNGGTFLYHGKEPLKKAGNLEMTSYREGDGVQQVFTKPDPATADDAEPGVDVGPYDSLSTDELMALQSMEYEYREKSGINKAMEPLRIFLKKIFGKKKDNSTPPDQSVDLAMSALDEVTKGGPGSGRQPEGGPKQEEEHERTGRAVASAKASMNRAINRADENPNDAKAEKNRQQKVKEYVAATTAHESALRAKLESLKKSGPTDRSEHSVEKVLKSKETIPILKAERKKQIVYCVVLEPEVLDSQDDWMTAEDIEETAHAYLAKSRVVGSGHSKPINGVPVESYIAPQDLSFSGGPYGDQKVKKGSWVLGIKVHDPDEWKKVETGEYSGFSIGGLGLRD